MQWLPSKAPLLPCDSHVTVGVSLDPDHAFSVLDMGPAADSKEVSMCNTWKCKEANCVEYYLSLEISGLDSLTSLSEIHV